MLGCEYPDELNGALKTLKGIQAKFNKKAKAKVSLADLIVLAGGTAIEKAAKDGGQDITVPFAPGRTDATQETTNEASFSHLELHADAFRNFYNQDKADRSPTDLLVDKSALLQLSVPEMTVLWGA